MAMVVSADEVDATMAVRPRERMDLMVGLEIADNNYLDEGIGRAAAAVIMVWLWFCFVCLLSEERWPCSFGERERDLLQKGDAGAQSKRLVCTMTCVE